MDVIGIVTLAIAVWGAILSTYLAAREIMMERRSIKIILLYLPWHDGYRLSITNVGHRPITITEIGLTIQAPNNGGCESIRANSSFISDDHPKFPFILTDGQIAEFYLSTYISERLSHDNFSLFIDVYDSEGNVYRKYSKAKHDTKYGRIMQ